MSSNLELLESLVYEIDEDGDCLTKWEVEWVAEMIDGFDKGTKTYASDKEVVKAQQIYVERVV